MKNNTTKKASAKKKLLPAAGSLLISAAMLGTSTYAWFTMNKEVTVTGMEVHTKVGSNLLITEDSYKLTTTNDNKDEKYKTDIKQLRKCLLEPASTVNGVDYWYTVDASADGKKLSGASYLPYSEGSGTSLDNETAGKTAYVQQFNEKYTTYPSGGFTAGNVAYTDKATPGAAYGYVDYTFYIKATSDAANQHVALTKCNLQYDGGELNNSGSIPDIDKAWRVAVFTQDATMNTDVSTAPTADNLITILKPDDAENHETGKAVNSASSIATIPKQDLVANFAPISTSGATAYYRVTVRLWLEGEDKTCTSETYAKLTEEYTLDLEFKLQESSGNGVTEIGSEAGWYGKASGS